MSAGYRALREGAGALRWPRQAVRVAGPDAEAYLQGQTSQDVARLAPGSWAWSLVLQPQGKLDAFVRVYRLAGDEFVLDCDAGMGEALVARLLRFRLRTKAEVAAVDWQFVAVRGPLATPPSQVPEGTHVIGFEWGGLSGYDLAGPSADPPAGLPEVSPSDHNAALVEAGFPRHGAELDERTIPAEAGLVAACVSFTKGCYTGQELVARIDSRGSNVPRHLVGLLASPQPGLDQPAPGEPAPGEPQPGEPQPRDAGAQGPAVGDLLYAADEEREVGRVTSVARSPRLGPVALGYVGRGRGPGDAVRARHPDGGAAVPLRVAALPL